MIKRLLLICFLVFSVAKANNLDNVIQNIIGDEKYQLHQILIQTLIQKNSHRLIINDQINYTRLLELLKRNGLLTLKLKKPSQVEVEFEFNNPRIGYKNIKEILSILGFSYYNTQYITKQDNISKFGIDFVSDYIIDPYIFNLELNKLNSKIVYINKKEKKWYYKIDFTNSYVPDSIKVELNEKIKLYKPLKPYLLRVENGAKSLKVISRRLNRWFPKIAIFDKELNVLKTVEKNSFFKRINISLPQGARYILIDDKYSLINIKRGLTIIIKG